MHEIRSIVSPSTYRIPIFRIALRSENQYREPDRLPLICRQNLHSLQGPHTGHLSNPYVHASLLGGTKDVIDGSRWQNIDLGFADGTHV